MGVLHKEIEPQRERRERKCEALCYVFGLVCPGCDLGSPLHEHGGSGVFDDGAAVAVVEALGGVVLLPDVEAEGAVGALGFLFEFVEVIAANAPVAGVGEEGDVYEVDFAGGAADVEPADAALVQEDEIVGGVGEGVEVVVFLGEELLVKELVFFGFAPGDEGHFLGAGGFVEFKEEGVVVAGGRTGGGHGGGGDGCEAIHAVVLVAVVYGSLGTQGG